MDIWNPLNTIGLQILHLIGSCHEMMFTCLANCDTTLKMLYHSLVHEIIIPRPKKSTNHLALTSVMHRSKFIQSFGWNTWLIVSHPAFKMFELPHSGFYKQLCYIS